MSRETEAEKITDFLKGKYVRIVWRHRSSEVGIEFDDGTRLYVDWKPEGFEFSITGGRLEADDAGATMRYMKVEWKHQHGDEPVWLYSELDEERWEVRKVDVFRGGSMAYADPSASHETTFLGEVPTPSLAEIASDPEFEPAEITKEEFEAIWRAAILAKRDSLKSERVNGAPMTDLETETAKLNDLLIGKYVRMVWRARSAEVSIEFDDGTRLIIDSKPDGFEFSVTGGRLDADDAD